MPATYTMVLCGVLLGQPWLVATTNVMGYLYHRLNTRGFVRVNADFNGWKIVHPDAGNRNTNGLVG
tara:strand:+ start:369 stop:566 length:198 start_codon:yes stop_codon:yes gene_type:complete